jgi:hypothetical protein
MRSSGASIEKEMAEYILSSMLASNLVAEALALARQGVGAEAKGSEDLKVRTRGHVFCGTPECILRLMHGGFHNKKRLVCPRGVHLGEGLNGSLACNVAVAGFDCCEPSD